MCPFKLKPAAKSSTSILISTPGAVACPRCGCRDINDEDAHKRNRDHEQAWMHLLLPR